jgi:hypothetical protein
MDLQVGGVSKFYINKSGFPTISTPVVYSFANSSATWVFTVGGADCGGFKSTGLTLASTLAVAWTVGTSGGGATSDLTLFRDAANTLAQRNGTNAQTFRLYNTFTDASNYERGFMRWNANVLEIGTEAGGTGSTARQFNLCPTSSTNIWSTRILAPSTAAGSIATLDFVVSTNNTAAAWAQIYGLRVDSITYDLGLRGRLIAVGPTGTGAVNTSAFPALKRSATTLQVRLADDSGFASVQGKITTETAYTATTIVPTGYVTIYDSTGTAYKVACSL